MKIHYYKSQAFTLIEIMLALFIFAIISIILSTILYSVFNTQERTQHRAQHLNKLQYAQAVIELDLKQIVARAIRDERNDLLAAVIGNSKTIEFTRAGFINPLAEEQRSTLQRVSYSIKNNQLVRKTWNHIDRTIHTKSFSRILLTDITAFKVNYLNEKNTYVTQWPLSANPKQALPKAIELSFKYSDWGEMRLVFAISS